MSNRYAGFNDQVIAEFRATGGQVGQFGDHLLLVHHVGAKSGTERVTPLMSIRRDEDTWWVTASAAGADRNPAWLHNLQAHPNTVVEAAGEGAVRVRARVLEGAERDVAYDEFKVYGPAWGQYEQRTSRIIPVVEFTRAG